VDVHETPGQKLSDKYGVEMIAPNRRNRGKSQDRRKLRRYTRRWRVEKPVKDGAFTRPEEQ
jgi:hypothetical protein